MVLCLLLVCCWFDLCLIVCLFVVVIDVVGVVYGYFWLVDFVCLWVRFGLIVTGIIPGSGYFI